MLTVNLFVLISYVPLHPVTLSYLLLLLTVNVNVCEFPLFIITELGAFTVAIFVSFVVALTLTVFSSNISFSTLAHPSANSTVYGSLAVPLPPVVVTQAFSEITGRTPRGALV